MAKRQKRLPIWSPDSDGELMLGVIGPVTNIELLKDTLNPDTFEQTRGAYIKVVDFLKEHFGKHKSVGHPSKWKLVKTERVRTLTGR